MVSKMVPFGTKWLPKWSPKCKKIGHLGNDFPPSAVLELIFHYFSCFFTLPFQRTFFEGPSFRSSSKVRFGIHFRILRSAKIEPGSDTFYQKDSKPVPRIYRECPGADLDAIWHRKWSKNAFFPIWVHFLLILKDC